MFNNEVCIILDISNTHNTKLAFVVGDFNINLIKSNVHTPTSEFFNIISIHSFIPIILYPTRLTDTSSTLIDKYFVNNTEHCFDTAIIYSDISDYFLLAMHFNTILQNPKPFLEFSKPLYPPQTIESFKSTIFEIILIGMPCFLSTQCDNSSYCYSLLISKYLEAIHDHFMIMNKNTPRHDCITKG